MAQRPAFFIRQGTVVSQTYSFEWFPGFAISQKQRSIESLHHAILRANPDGRPLEVSTKSTDALGSKLSAFRLRLDGYLLETVFQSAKVFERGGPFPDLLTVPPRDAKHDVRLRSSGVLTAFRYQDEDFPLVPKTAFYDFIYLSAVKQSLAPEELRALSGYDFFTDIAFNPAKSVSTQARSAALLRLLLDEYGRLPDFSKEDFLQYHRNHVDT